MIEIGNTRIVIPDRFQIVQIGAFDGILGEEYGFRDVLLNHSGDALLVEPIPENFELLKTNYSQAKANITFEQVCINPSKEVEMFVDGGCSHLAGCYGGENRKITVKGCTMMELLNKYNIGKIDFLSIDTEGFDVEVLKMIDFSTVSIQFIRYEHKWCRNNNEGTALLEHNGYKVSLCPVDPEYNFIAEKRYTT